MRGDAEMGCWKLPKSWDFQWFSSVLSETSGGGCLWLYLLGDFHYLFAYDYTCDYQFWDVQLKESPRCTANAQWNAPRNAVIYNVSCLQTKTSQGSCHWGLLHIITAYYHNLPELFWWFSPPVLPRRISPCWVTGPRWLRAFCVTIECSGTQWAVFQQVAPCGMALRIDWATWRLRMAQ